MTKKANIADANTNHSVTNSQGDQPKIPSSGEITIDDIRSLPRYAHLSDAEARRKLLLLKQYCSLIYDCFTQTKGQDHESNDQ